MELYLTHFESPLGPIAVVASSVALVYLDFAASQERREQLLSQRPGDYTLVPGDPHGAQRALAAYFAGDLAALDGLPVDPAGTEFQRRVWLALRTIPVGATRSYGALAAQLGVPGGARAVGITNSLNPLSLVLPCHRVIGASGALTGYAGGLERKAWLLRHEGALPAASAQLPLSNFA